MVFGDNKIYLTLLTVLGYFGFLNVHLEQQQIPSRASDSC
jgi:hypothetical protein